MAKQTKWYYVLVMTNQGPVFVTGIGEKKTAFWNCEQKPEAFSKEYTEDMAFGLTVNGHTAFSVCTRYELDNQPYLYSKGQFEWRWNEDDKDETVN